jgi:Tfp pilus assembly protein PilN
MRAQLNLATKPFETHRLFLLGAGVGSAVAALLFLSLGWHAYRIRRADQEIRTKTAEVESQMEIYRRERRDLEQFFAKQENAKLHDRAAYLNTLIDARSFNWTQMFIDMEHLLPGGVRVVSIAPKLENGRVVVKLSVGAASDEAKLKFLRALEGSKEFANVQLVSERPPTGNATGDQSVIELTATYTRL